MKKDDETEGMIFLKESEKELMHRLFLKGIYI